MKKCLTILAAGLVFMFGLQCLGAQQSTQPAFSTDAAAERIPNLDTIKKELRQYHDCTCTCGCYAHDLDVQADRAIAFLRQRAARRTPNEKSGAKEKLALILDIDETALSNYKELVGADFAYNAAVFDAWVDTAQAPAIPGTLRLYKEAQRLGVSVFFITGRPEPSAPQRSATCTPWASTTGKSWPCARPRTARRPSAPSKPSVRGQIVAQGYTLILNVGDQWSDLKGKPEAEFSVKYPDPFYFIP